MARRMEIPGTLITSWLDFSRKGVRLTTVMFAPEAVVSIGLIVIMLTTWPPQA